VFLLCEVQRFCGPGPHAERNYDRSGRGRASSTFIFRDPAPTPEPIIFSFTWSVESFGSIFAKHFPRSPATSALITIPNSLTSPALQLFVASWSSVIREPLIARPSLPFRACLPLAVLHDVPRALGFIGHLGKDRLHPAHLAKPSNFDGRRRRAHHSPRGRDRQTFGAHTLPNTDPQMKESPPAFSVPFCYENRSQPGPRSLVTRDFPAPCPSPGASGLAFSSRKSANQQNCSAACRCRFSFFAGKLPTKLRVAAPHSAGHQAVFGVSAASRAPVCASGLSILLIATMIGTFRAARAVVDRFLRLRPLTPSSAATTSTTIIGNFRAFRARNARVKRFVNPVVSTKQPQRESLT